MTQNIGVTVEKVAPLFGVMCAVVLLATVLMSGSALAAEQQHDDCHQTVVQTQSNAQVDTAVSDERDQQNTNQKQTSEEAGDESKDADGDSSDSCHARTNTIVQTQSNVQINVGVMNEGDQTNTNTQRQAAAIEQDSTQSKEATDRAKPRHSTVIQRQSNKQINVGVLNEGEATNRNTQQQTARAG